MGVLWCFMVFYICDFNRVLCVYCILNFNDNVSLALVRTCREAIMAHNDPPMVLECSRTPQFFNLAYLVF